jgi:CheY-like chemotaxis protein
VPSQSSLQRPLRVLVVDDVRDSADSLAFILAISGYDAHATYDGYTAVACVQREPPDIVILDIWMPGIDGYETARRIRQLRLPVPPRLIALTANSSDADRQRSRHEGLELHLVKPVDPEQLCAVLNSSRPPRAPGRSGTDCGA